MDHSGARLRRRPGKGSGRELAGGPGCSPGGPRPPSARTGAGPHLQPLTTSPPAAPSTAGPDGRSPIARPGNYGHRRARAGRPRPPRPPPLRRPSTRTLIRRGGYSRLALPLKSQEEPLLAFSQPQKSTGRVPFFLVNRRTQEMRGNVGGALV